MKFLKVFLLVAVASVFTNCVKNTTFTPTIFEGISEQFKTYAVFDSNGYWIYRNEKNSVIDTVKIRGYYTERRFNSPIGDIPGFYYEAYIYSYDSKATGIQSGEVFGGYSDDEDVAMTESYRLYFNNDRYFTIFTPMIPVDSLLRLGLNEGNYRNIAYYPTLTVGDINYSEVYESSVVDYKNAPDTMFMSFFMAKNHGLIRYTKRANDLDEDWVLIGSDLAQVE